MTRKDQNEMQTLIVGPMSPMDALSLLGKLGETHEVRHSLAMRLESRSDIVTAIDPNARLVVGQRLTVEPNPKTLDEVGMVRWLDIQFPY